MSPIHAVRQKVPSCPAFGPGRTARGVRPLALTGIALSVSLALGPARAQQSVIEEVTVTGSRIEREVGFTSPVPVTAVTTDELTTLDPNTTLVDQLDALPQFFQTQSAQRGGGVLFGTAGGSYLNVRGMGDQRTLILIDGARTVPADRNSRVNIDNIPNALLQRVEVVTGGASAAYGADALAGVTNFILNREFEGMEFDVRTGLTSEGDGENWAIDLAGGTALTDRLHLVGAVGVQQIEQIDRNRHPEDLGDWFQRYGFVQNPEWSPGAPPGVPQRLVVPFVHSSMHSPGGIINDAFGPAGPVPFTLDRYTFLPDGRSVRPFAMGDIGCHGSPAEGCTIQSTMGGPEFSNANVAFTGGPYGAEVKRWNTFVGLQFDASDRTRIFGHLLAGETQSNQHDRPGNPHLMGIWNATIYRENPYLPAVVRERMFAEGVDRIRVDKLGQIFGPGNSNFADAQDDRNSFETWSIAFGVDHSLFSGDNWRMQARLQRGETDKYTASPNILRVDRMFLAIDAVSVDPVTGELLGDDPGEDPSAGVIMCNVQRYNPTPEQLAAAVANVRVPAPQGDDSLGGPEDLVPIPGPIGPDGSIENCVPMNIFGHGNVSDEARRYVTSPKWGRSAVVQSFAELLFQGDIWQGFGPGPFSMAAGVTYREESFWQRGFPVELMKYGPPQNAPQLGIRGIPPGFTGGSANLHEFSTVPAISGEFDVTEVFSEFIMPLYANGDRRLELNLAGRRSDYSLGGEITAYKTGLDFAVNDALRLRTTLSRDVREATFSERFDLQGGGGSVDDPAFNDAQFQITVTTGGNPNLAPEEADTLTAGFVYQPNRIPGLQFSADWYRIELSDAIGTLGQQRIVDECFDNGVLCDLVQRDANGIITNVRNVFLNVDEALVRGIDYELVYSTEPDFFSNLAESLSFRLLAGVMLDNKDQPAGGASVERAGGYQWPELKTTAFLNYQIGNYRIGLQHRYYDSGLLNVNWVEGVHVDDNTVESQSVVNLTLGYDRDVGDGGQMRLSLTVTNLLDADPPVIAAYGDRGGAQLVSPNYDIFGRRYSLGLNYSF